MYAEISVVVAGALDEKTTWTDETALDEYLAQLKEDAQSDGYRYEVYRVDHDHAPGDCECIQFLTDHHPYRVFNENGNA